eukprot:1126651-Rhodomonas_salina.1
MAPRTWSDKVLESGLSDEPEPVPVGTRSLGCTTERHLHDGGGPEVSFESRPLSLNHHSRARLVFQVEHNAPHQPPRRARVWAKTWTELRGGNLSIRLLSAGPPPLVRPFHPWAAHAGGFSTRARPPRPLKVEGVLQEP